jgi:uncharacterized phage protein (TIGR01671 family)
MEDRYLCKAKIVDNEEWVQGYLFDDGFENGRIFIGGLVIEKYNGTACDDWNVTGIDFCEVDPSTICRCTGLKDKNGNLIWENDIIAYRDCTEEKYVIAWELDKACFEYQQYSCSIMNFDELSSCEVEVIGNIFDNPELLESEG